MPKSPKNSSRMTKKPQTARARVLNTEAAPELIGKFPFTREMATFRANLLKLLDREGDWVLIRGEEIGGIFDDPVGAAAMGYRTYGFSGFMIRELTAVEPRFAFARPVTG